MPQNCNDYKIFLSVKYVEEKIRNIKKIKAKKLRK